MLDITLSASAMAEILSAETPTEVLLTMWRAIVHNWDSFGPGSLSPGAYSLPEAQAQPIIDRIISVGGSRMQWVNIGPATRKA